MKKKIIIGLLTLGIVVGITVSILTVSNIDNKSTQTENTNKVDETNEKELTKKLITIFDGVYTKEEINKMTYEEKKALLTPQNKNTNSSQSDNSKKEYPKEKTEILYKELVTLSGRADFSGVINKIKGEKNKYSFVQDYNKKIKDIYYDATAMLSTLTVGVEQKGKIVKSMKDPEMIVIGTMLIPEKSRRNVFYSKSSISPIFDGVVTIKNHVLEYPSNSKDPKVQHVKSFLETTEVVHKITFSIENNELTAYISQTPSGDLTFYGVFTPEGKINYYKNVKFWEQMDADYEKHESLKK